MTITLLAASEDPLNIADIKHFPMINVASLLP